MKGFATPPGTTWVKRLGGGGSFRVDLVQGSRGERLVVKRPVSADLASCVAFERERAVLCRLHAPGIIPRVMSSGEDNEGPYLLETRVAGHILPLGRPLSVVRWLIVASSSLRSLAHLHELRDASGPLEVVHGDIAPTNVLFRGGSSSLVGFVDFGGATCARSGLPPPGGRGTVPYAAPELVRGEQPADRSCDVYALCALLFALAVPEVTEARSVPARILEVGSRGLRLERLAGRWDLPLRARRALVSALSFRREDREADSRALSTCMRVIA